MTDIANEPDDEESFVRFLLYTDQMDVAGMAATTSTWLRDAVHPERLRERIAAYGQVLPNLRAHDPAYPDAQALMARVTAGPALYGLAGVGDGHDSPASDALIAAVDAPDPRPLWVTIWGGANVLAQALHHVAGTRTPEQVAAFVARLRVYAISDQDDGGPWIRVRYPRLFWIGSISAFSHYSTATWTGISGEGFYQFPGPDSTSVSHQWLDAHIRKGPLGELYPQWKFIMEGDTPSFLYLVDNGLNAPEHPDYGGWGGRYGLANDGMGLYTDVVDTAVGADGSPHRSAQATIWRWREAYQNDFAARIGWTLTPDARAGRHPPVVVVNGQEGTAPLEVSLKPGDSLALDASASRSPDGGAVTFRWWQYKEPSTWQDAVVVVPDLLIQGADGAKAVVTVPTARPMLPGPQRLHVILEVRGGGDLPLTRYRRVIIDVAQP
nr:nucleoside hydrolase-like domain-containing protein [Nitrospirillum iridis]